MNIAVCTAMTSHVPSPVAVPMDAIARQGNM